MPLNRITNSFRIIAFLEGVSYLLLLFIAVPIKYNFGDVSYVKLLGMPHGILFIVYIVIAFLMQFGKYGSALELKILLKELNQSKRLKAIGICLLVITVSIMIDIFLVEKRAVGYALYIFSTTLTIYIWKRIVNAKYLCNKKKWGNKVFLIILLASLIPFGTFYIDRKYLKT